jgi:hypothetical protein
MDDCALEYDVGRYETFGWHSVACVIGEGTGNDGSSK